MNTYLNVKLFTMSAGCIYETLSQQELYYTKFNIKLYGSFSDAVLIYVHNAKAEKEVRTPYRCTGIAGIGVAWGVGAQVLVLAGKAAGRPL